MVTINFQQIIKEERNPIHLYMGTGLDTQSTADLVAAENSQKYLILLGLAFSTPIVTDTELYFRGKLKLPN